MAWVGQGSGPTGRGVRGAAALAAAAPSAGGAGGVPPACAPPECALQPLQPQPEATGWGPMGSQGVCALGPPRVSSKAVAPLVAPPPAAPLPVASPLAEDREVVDPPTSGDSARLGLEPRPAVPTYRLRCSHTWQSPSGPRVHARHNGENEEPAKITYSISAFFERPCRSCGRERKSRHMSTHRLAVSRLQ